MDDERGKTTMDRSLQRPRRLNRESKNSLSHLYRSDYKPEKYANKQLNCNGCDTTVTEDYAQASANSSANVDRKPYISNKLGDSSVLPVNGVDSAGTLFERPPQNHAGVHLNFSSSSSSAVDTVNGLRNGGVKYDSIRDASLLQNAMSSEDLVNQTSPLHPSSASVHPNSFKYLNNRSNFSNSLDISDGALSSSMNSWPASSSVGVTDDALMSPDSEKSQATSVSVMSTSVDSSNSASHGSSSLLSLLPQSDASLAHRYFPVTFGATLHQPVLESSDPLALVQPTLTLPKKKTSGRSRSSVSRRQHFRPGSGHSSSSSNSKSSIDRIYLMASDSTGNGGTMVLVSTPYQTQLAKLQMEQLQIEEERLRHLRIQNEVERMRSPIRNWYEMRSPQFHYEAHKHNERLKGSGSGSGVGGGSGGGGDGRLKTPKNKPNL